MSAYDRLMCATCANVKGYAVWEGTNVVGKFALKKVSIDIFVHKIMIYLYTK